MKEARVTTVWRWRAGGAARPESDEVAHEEPLEIRVGGNPISVTMRTPGHDAELAIGFLLTEGLISRAADVVAVEPYLDVEDCNIADVRLAPGIEVDFQSLTRHVFASSSCGLCGKATIEAVHRSFPPVHSAMVVRAETLLSLPDLLRREQATFDRTGGLHAAALFEADGTLIALREDVGRHNAVDKVLGYALRQGILPLARQVLFVSGRTSFEIVQKALAGGLPVVAGVSAPSSLAIDFARASGQTLIGFVRQERLNVYTLPERIRFPTTPLPTARSTIRSG